MTNAQIVSALSQLAEAVRGLTERLVLGEVTQREAVTQLHEIRGRLDKLDTALSPVATHYRDQEAVVKARAQIHQEEEVRRGAWADLLAPVRAVLAHPFAATVALGLLIALAGWLGIKLPKSQNEVPTVILENAGSTLTRATIGPRGQG